jgi:hypothetical protein
MTTYRLKVWTGPTLVVELGRRMRRAGLHVITGTEHVYVDAQGTGCDAAEHNMRAALYRKYKKDYGLRAVSCSRRPSVRARRRK